MSHKKKNSSSSKNGSVPVTSEDSNSQHFHLQPSAGLPNFPPVSNYSSFINPFPPLQSQMPMSFHASLSAPPSDFGTHNNFGLAPSGDSMPPFSNLYNEAGNDSGDYDDEKSGKKRRTNYRRPENAAKLNAAVNALIMQKQDPNAPKDIRSVSKIFNIPYNTLRDNYLRVTTGDLRAGKRQKTSEDGEGSELFDGNYDEEEEEEEFGEEEEEEEVLEEGEIPREKSKPSKVKEEKPSKSSKPTK